MRVRKFTERPSSRASSRLEHRRLRVSPVATKRLVRQRAKGPIDPAIGQRMKQLRIARGLTQADLAAKDFSKGFISLVETGHTRISLRAAEVLARRLGVSVSE